MIIHIVRPGESIRKIADSYHCEVSDITSNNMHITDFSHLVAGTKLRIPFLSKDIMESLEETESFISDYYPSYSGYLDGKKKENLTEESKPTKAYEEKSNINPSKEILTENDNSGEVESGNEVMDMNQLSPIEPLREDQIKEKVVTPQEEDKIENSTTSPQVVIKPKIKINPKTDPRPKTEPVKNEEENNTIKKEMNTIPPYYNYPPYVIPLDVPFYSGNISPVYDPKFIRKI